MDTLNNNLSILQQEVQPLSSKKKKKRLKLPSDAYKALLRTVYERDGWRCRICKRRDGLSAHHIKFRSQGGDDAESNLITLCTACHKAVHDRNLLITLDNDFNVDVVERNGWQTQNDTAKITD